MYIKSKYYPSGDNGVVIKVGDEISQDINKKIRELVYCIEKEQINEIVEIIPTYTSILIIYNPLETTFESLVQRLEYIENSLQEMDLPLSEVIHIPVLYGGDFGMDLENVASHNNLTPQEVIDIHCSVDYLIYMLGFTPGFPYLGGMSERIATPRLEIPRQKIAAGSVGIAGKQTGIYPIDSPGGWQIIGKTPVKLFDPQRDPAVLLKAGNYIRFEPIDENEYHEILKEVESNTYKVIKSLSKGSNKHE